MSTEAERRGTGRMDVMEPPVYRSTPHLNEIWRDVCKLDLQANIAELEVFGFTVIEPAKVGSPELQDRALEAILATHERATGQRIDDLASTEELAGSSAHFAIYQGILYENRVFEEMLLHPIVTTLARYLTGKSSVVFAHAGHLRARREAEAMGLHIDTQGPPAPLPHYAQVCNVTWTHTDYTMEDGALALVPGSHRWCRRPLPGEVDAYGDDSPHGPIAVEARAGSLICWHGNTWHGAWPRSNPGVRVATLMGFCRSYMRPTLDHARLATAAMLDRNPVELREFLGLLHPHPVADVGWRHSDISAWYLRAGADQWA